MASTPDSKVKPNPTRDERIFEAAVALVTAHVSRTPTPAQELPGLIRQVTVALREIWDQAQPLASAPVQGAPSPAPAPAALASRRTAAPMQVDMPLEGSDVSIKQGDRKITQRPIDAGPAVPVKKSVAPDHVVCLECGERFQAIKRHLGSKHGLTPDAYRAKWGLKEDHPIVAPNYQARKREEAARVGLGHHPNRGKRRIAEVS